MIRILNKVMMTIICPMRMNVRAQEKNELDKFRLRLSQCIILPPFQSQGHGARLLRAFYQFGRDDASVMDMSVEDPCSEFQTMRDITGQLLACSHVLALSFSNAWALFFSCLLRARALSFCCWCWEW